MRTWERVMWRGTPVCREKISKNFEPYAVCDLTPEHTPWCAAKQKRLATTDLQNTAQKYPYLSMCIFKPMYLKSVEVPLHCYFSIRLKSTNHSKIKWSWYTLHFCPQYLKKFEMKIWYQTIILNTKSNLSIFPLAARHHCELLITFLQILILKTFPTNSNDTANHFLHFRTPKKFLQIP